MNINELNFKIKFFENDVYLVKNIKKRVRNTDFFNEYFFFLQWKSRYTSIIKNCIISNQTDRPLKNCRHKTMRENGIFSLKSTLIRYG